MKHPKNPLENISENETNNEVADDMSIDESTSELTSEGIPELETKKTKTKNNKNPEELSKFLKG